MKTNSSILTIIIIACLSGGLVKSEKPMVDHMMDMLRGVMPCTIPCILDNVNEIMEEVLIECVSNQIINLIPMIPEGEGEELDFLQLLRDTFADTGEICDAVKEMTTCVKGILGSKNRCGGQLAASMKTSSDTLLRYIGCDSQINLPKCLLSENSIAAMGECVKEFTTHNRDIIEEFDDVTDDNISREVYNRILSKKDLMCGMAKDFSTCMLKMEGPDCNEPTLNDMEYEMDAVRKLINCIEPDDYNDGVKCFGNPTLQDEIGKCIDQNKNDIESMGNAFSATADPIALKINKKSLCPLPKLLNCIKDPVNKYNFCKGWSKDLTNDLLTPILDYMKYVCDKKSKAVHKCKDKYDDYPFNTSTASKPTAGGHTLVLCGLILGYVKAKA